MLECLYTMDEAAKKLRISRRFLQDIIKDHPYYKAFGSKKLFTDEDVSRIIEAMSRRGISARRARVARRTDTSGASISESLLTAVRELANAKRRRGYSQHGSGKPNVVSFPSPPTKPAPSCS